MPASPTSLDRHAKRHLADNFEWRNRLEQLAEMRRVAVAANEPKALIADGTGPETSASSRPGVANPM